MKEARRGGADQQGWPDKRVQGPQSPGGEADQQGWPDKRVQGPQSPGGEADLGQVRGRESCSAESRLLMG